MSVAVVVVAVAVCGSEVDGTTEPSIYSGDQRARVSVRIQPAAIEVQCVQTGTVHC